MPDATMHRPARVALCSCISPFLKRSVHNHASWGSAGFARAKPPTERCAALSCDVYAQDAVLEAHGRLVANEGDRFLLEAGRMLGKATSDTNFSTAQAWLCGEWPSTLTGVQT